MGGAAAATEVVIDDDGDGDGEQAALTQKFQTAVSLTEGGEEPSDMVVDDEGNVKPAPDTNVTAGPTRDGSPELVGDEAAEAGAKAEKEDSDMDMLDSDDEAKASLGIVPDSQVDPPPPPPPPAPVARFPIKPTPFGPSQEPPKSKAAQVEPEPEPSAPSVLVEDQVVTDATLAQQLSDASKDETKCAFRLSTRGLITDASHSQVLHLHLRLARRRAQDAHEEAQGVPPGRGARQEQESQGHGHLVR